jgi:hypothetical protein
MAGELVDRLAILAAVPRFHGMGDANSRSLRSDNYVRMHHFVRRTAFVPFRRLWGDVRRDEFVQRLSVAFRGILGSHLRDALQQGNVDDVACLLVPRAKGFPLFSTFAWWPPLLFLVKNGLQ